MLSNQKPNTNLCGHNTVLQSIKKLQIKDGHFLKIYYHTKLQDPIVLLPHYSYHVIIDHEIKKYRGGMATSDMFIPSIMEIPNLLRTYEE
jgi:hypothetical protein